ncbi:HET-domain-containing protein [Trametes sanguinea]|nr:HET-domain-containing protein [Trametes sanguinea]
MWLLSTSSLKLQYFNSPAEIPGGYAILSHVWQSEEQSFQDIKRLEADNVSIDDERVCAKIRGCVRTAREHGFDWVWIDTCCIDKTSSAELQEAINSMFRWYSEARICFAYLADVPSSQWQRLSTDGSSFRNSKWFLRGWTLQELIAPKHLLFVSAEWMYLGSKASLAHLLQDITRVDAEILTFHRQLDHFSVARRMSWASSRQTTRPEDEAYSLLGLFDITMPTIYGEGRHAFRRLQEEIMKRSSDRTLLAWGGWLRLPAGGSWHHRWGHGRGNSLYSLLAECPGRFGESAGIVPLTLPQLRSAVQPFLNISLPVEQAFYADIVTTGHGLCCQWLVIDGLSVSVALLPCANEAGTCLGLLLSTPESGSKHLFYGVGNTLHLNLGNRSLDFPQRLVEVNTALVGFLASSVTSRQETQVPDRYLSGSPSTKLLAHMKTIYLWPHVPFDFSAWSLLIAHSVTLCIPDYAIRYLARFGFHLRTPAHTGRRLEGPLELTIETQHNSTPLSRARNFPVAFSFAHELSGEEFCVVLGLRPGRYGRSRSLWPGAMVDIYIFPAYSGRRSNIHQSTRPKYLQSCFSTERPETRPACHTEHSYFCPGTNVFIEEGDTRRNVQLAIIWTPRGSEAHYYTLDFALRGTVYDAQTDGPGTTVDILTETAGTAIVDLGGRSNFNCMRMRNMLEAEVELAASTTPFTVSATLNITSEGENSTIARPYSLVEYYWVVLSSRLRNILLLPPVEKALFKASAAGWYRPRSQSVGSIPRDASPILTAKMRTEQTGSRYSLSFTTYVTARRLI